MIKGLYIFLGSTILLGCSSRGIGAHATATAEGRVGAEQSLRREIEAVNDSMTAAFNAGDVLRAARFYADDARIDGKGGVLVQGREAIDKYWLDIKNAKSWKLEVLDVGGRHDQPYQIGRSTLITSSPAGDRRAVVEFLAIWRRERSGGLRMVVDYYRY